MTKNAYGVTDRVAENAPSTPKQLPSHPNNSSYDIARVTMRVPRAPIARPVAWPRARLARPSNSQASTIATLTIQAMLLPEARVGTESAHGMTGSVTDSAPSTSNPIYATDSVLVWVPVAPMA